MLFNDRRRRRRRHTVSHDCWCCRFIIIIILLLYDRLEHYCVQDSDGHGEVDGKKNTYIIFIILYETEHLV